jgi:hypothetical protein
VGGSWTLLADKVGQATKLDYGTTIMTHRIAHLADKAHFVSHTLARINSAIIFGLVGGGLFACVLCALAYDIGRAFAVW